MRKVFFAAAIAGLAFFSTSCKKETTCECQRYIVDSDDGSKTADGDPETRVIESRDADCSQFNEYTEVPLGDDTSYECEEKVFD